MSEGEVNLETMTTTFIITIIIIHTINIHIIKSTIFMFILITRLLSAKDFTGAIRVNLLLK